MHNFPKLISILLLHELFSVAGFTLLALIVFSLLADDGSPFVYVALPIHRVIPLLLIIQLVYPVRLDIQWLFNAVSMHL